MSNLTIPDVVTIARPDPALMRSAAELLALATVAYREIVTAEQCEAAGEDLKAIKLRQKQLEDARTSITKPLWEVQRAVNSLFKGPMDTLSEAEQIIKRGILEYQQAEERKRIELAAAATEALRKEREGLEAQATKAEASGKLEKAEALRECAAMVPEQIVVAPTAPKLTGVAARSTWRAEVIDKLSFVKHVAGHPEWLHLVEPNLVALNGLARSQRGALSLPGVKVTEERQLAARSG